MSEYIDVDAVGEAIYNQSFTLGAEVSDARSDILEMILQNIIRHTLTGNNNITTHYVEDGTHYEDVTTTDPLVLNIQGWMAELFYYNHELYRRVMVYIAQTAHLPVIGGFVATYLGDVAYIVNFIYERVRNLIKLYDEYIKQNKHDKNVSGYDDDLITFDESKRLGFQLACLENLRISRLPISISIPRVGVFHSMMLKNYEWDQDKSYYQAKVTMSFQQVRRTQTILTKLSNGTVTTREAEPPILRERAQIDGSTATARTGG